MDWPSLNQTVLMGKVTDLTRIQWDNGDVTARLTICTKKRVLRADGNGFTLGHSFHQAEVTPGDRVFKEAWEGAVVLVRGELDTFPWLPQGSTTEINRTVLRASGYQLIHTSAKPRTVPKTTLQAKRPFQKEP